MAAPIGNENAKKGKMWSDALRKQIVQRQAMDQLAGALIDKALDGDLAALREIGDRLEGKPTQVIAGDDEAPIVVQRIELVALGSDSPTT